MTSAVESSAAKPRDGVRQAICVPMARVLFVLLLVVVVVAW